MPIKETSTVLREAFSQVVDGCHWYRLALPSHSAMIDAKDVEKLRTKFGACPASFRSLEFGNAL